LRGDPTLQRVVRTYNSFTGESGDSLGPSPATCPYLQIAPKPTASKWEAEGMHNMPFTVVIAAAVNGTDVDQLMNFWGHVRRALWPADPTRNLAIQTLVAKARITRPTMTMQGFGAQPQRDGGHLLVAMGSLNVLLLIDTP
jgi:hypothetical protein